MFWELKTADEYARFLPQRLDAMIGLRHSPTPHDGHTLGEQLEQSSILLQDVPGAAEISSVQYT